MGIKPIANASKTLLAVPMVADTLHQSVTRNDAKQITDSRLKRLKLLSQKPEDKLSKPQKDEKKRIIRLEKNRRAAAMSRRKKKMYVKNMEQKNKLMERHIAILEMENAQLRSMVNAGGMPRHPMQQQQQQMQFMQQRMQMGNQYRGPPSGMTSESTSGMNSMEPSEAPSIKRRKLNDGSGSVTNASTSPSCMSPDDFSDDGDILQPLPVHNIDSDKENAVPPSLPPQQMIPQAPMMPPQQMPMRFMPQMPMQGMMPPGMQQQMQRFHPRYPPPPCHPQMNMNANMMQNPNMYAGAMQFQQHQQQQKVEGIVLDKDESKSEELHDIEMPHSRLSGDFLDMQFDEEFEIEEEEGECGSILAFNDEKDSKLFL